ncbi:MAG TPA: hypothetical protein VM580_28615 [Labilithrix sp.]|nr:hypothetical protein [Labilithrix sp.]
MPRTACETRGTHPTESHRGGAELAVHLGELLERRGVYVEGEDPSQDVDDFADGRGFVPATHPEPDVGTVDGPAVFHFDEHEPRR